MSVKKHIKKACEQIRKELNEPDPELDAAFLEYWEKRLAYSDLLRKLSKQNPLSFGYTTTKRNDFRTFSWGFYAARKLLAKDRK